MCVCAHIFYILKCSLRVLCVHVCVCVCVCVCVGSHLCILYCMSQCVFVYTENFVQGGAAVEEFQGGKDTMVY